MMLQCSRELAGTAGTGITTLVHTSLPLACICGRYTRWTVRASSFTLLRVIYRIFCNIVNQLTNLRCTSSKSSGHQRKGLFVLIEAPFSQLLAEYVFYVSGRLPLPCCNEKCIYVIYWLYLILHATPPSTEELPLEGMDMIENLPNCLCLLHTPHYLPNSFSQVLFHSPLPCQ